MTGKIFVLSFLLVAVFVINVNGQVKVPKASDLTNTANLVLPSDKAEFEKDFLKALDPGTDLGISADNLTKLLGNNKSYVSDVMGILGGSDSNDSKLSKLTGKNKGWKTAATSLLGDSTAGKYFAKVDNQLQSFKTKYQVAKLFLK
ncbi:MAG TPA: hypothetical protein VLQ91_11010 [Draconibacterium sp.]|nr:hypothetical protein [Draconibacterium sp.]